MALPVSPAGDLSPLFSRHRVVVCVGAGGVGKTTVAAAISLAAARSGRRTLCLTIDPARRLATSLGLSTFPRQELEVPREFFEAHGLSIAAPLTVMMLDARATFDEFISHFAESPEEARRITSHPVYEHLATNLAGTQSYMAMEKVLAVLDDERYDFIVLDTPPSDRALDFFDAPGKMADILDSPATRALVQALESGKRFHLNFLAAGFRRAMAGLEKITGTSLIADVADLLFQMNGLFGGFSSRAHEVGRRLRGSEFGYVLVASPSSASLTEARALTRAVRERNLRVDALAFNRVAQPGLSDADLSDFEPLMQAGLSSEGATTCASQARNRAHARRIQIERCHSLVSSVGAGVLSCYLPAFAEDVHDPENLMTVARLIAPAGFVEPT